MSDLSRSGSMYRAGLGLRLLGSFEDHEGFDGVMLGTPGTPHHLELTSCRTHPVTPRPTEEDLLVFYVPDHDEWERRCAAMRAAGFRQVPSFNPYWEVRGHTFQDPDGYRVVLQRESWTSSEAPAWRTTLMRSVTALSWVALVLLGCGGDAGGAPRPTEPTSIMLSTSGTGAMTATGETRSVTAVVRGADGAVLPSPAVSWSTSDEAVATVSGSGASATVTAVDDGSAIITATSDGVWGTLTVTVRRVLASVAVSAPSVLAYGSSVQLVVTARDPRGHAIEGVTGFTFGSSDPEEIADVRVDLQPGPQTSSQGSVTGSFTTADLRPEGTSLDAIISLMDRGDAYVEVASAEFPGGEIRGQVVEVSR